MSSTILLKYLSGDLVPLEIPMGFQTCYQLYLAVWEQRHPQIAIRALTLMTPEHGEIGFDLTPIELAPEQLVYVLIQDVYAEVTIEYAVEAICQYKSYDKFIVKVCYKNANGAPVQYQDFPFYYSGNDEIFVDVEVIDASEYGELIEFREWTKRMERITDILPQTIQGHREHVERQLVAQWENHVVLL